MTNVALVVLDTLRKDSFDEHFDWLPGTCFENAWSTSHWTVPAYVSLFTRRYGCEVGEFDSSYTGCRDDTEFGWRMEKKGSTKYDPDMVVELPTKPNSRIDHELEHRLRDEYREVIELDGIFKRINHVLWMRGFWDALDKVGYS